MGKQLYQVTVTTSKHVTYEIEADTFNAACKLAAQQAQAGVRPIEERETTEFSGTEIAP